VVFAGIAVNLCLGILYAWSVWKANLVAAKGELAGSAMTGLNAGWTYLTDAEGTWAYAICGITFALFMIPGGWVQDRLRPQGRRHGGRMFPRRPGASWPGCSKATGDWCWALD